MEKLVYFFSPGHTDISEDGKKILGGKGDGLAKMTKMGIPVPPGFTISTKVCQSFYENNYSYTEELTKEVEDALVRLQKTTEKTFGGEENPLLVSVRSGAAISMPGMMDTILNLGLNDKTVEALAKKTNNPRFAYDAYRRFIQMFSNVVEEIREKEFDIILTQYKKKLNVKTDSELPVESLKEIVVAFKEIYKKHKQESFPQDVKTQLWKAINAVFLSWNSERAIAYRKINQIHGLIGTAVNVCTMVFGNMGEDSGTGVAFTRNPSTGDKELFGEFLANAQGEDIVAGTRTPDKISFLKKTNPTLYNQFIETANTLEKSYKDMQDIEFTIEQNKLYLLQTRSGKRTGNASIKIAHDLFQEGLITKEEALLLVDANLVAHSLLPVMDPDYKDAKILTTGVKASFGVAIGKIIFDPKKLENSNDGEDYILVCEETSPEYLMAMYRATGIATSKGGATSHAAVVTRAMGKPCVVGCSELDIDEENGTCSINGTTLKEGDIISLNATDGQIIEGKVPILIPKLDAPEIQNIMKWAQETKSMNVRVNADTPKECELALSFGAQGVGLTRTEHMFFEKDRIMFMREMIFANNKEDRVKALDKLFPFQKDDFYSIFKIMHGKPITIRLLDPPLHEFLPREEEELEDMAKHLGSDYHEVHKKAAMLKEENPMLGLRGCRLGLLYPEIMEMQTRAIMSAACEVKKELNSSPEIEIMVPLTGTTGEMKISKDIIKKEAQATLEKYGQTIPYKIGTMIEIPRAALIADQIAKEAEFFSFGTNDLTQMTFGFSRDDSHPFIELYQNLKILSHNPFSQVDLDGVGVLIDMASKKGKEARSDIKLGVCGEQGGDPRSIYFFHKTGIHYVSCSTFRIPTAILAAAQATILEKNNAL